MNPRVAHVADAGRPGSSPYPRPPDRSVLYALRAVRGTVVLVTSGFSAADLNGLLLAGVPPKFLRSLLLEHQDRRSWGDSPLRSGEDAAWRSVTPVDPGCPTVCLGSESYPWILSRLRTPPVLLYYHGPIERLLPGIGVAGSRDASRIGLSVARIASETAVELGAPVVSGLASGVDEAAHRAALDAGGFTVGFLGAALDQVAGRAAALISDVLDAGGLVLSEVPPGVGFSAGTLLARNRLVAAASYPLVVAEAALGSGSLAAARDAFALGVPLLAPLPPAAFRNHPNAAGLLALAGLSDHRLLRWPARLLNPDRELAPVANGVPATGDDLRDMLRVLYFLRPQSLDELLHRSPTENV